MKTLIALSFLFLFLGCEKTTSTTDSIQVINESERTLVVEYTTENNVLERDTLTPTNITGEFAVKQYPTNKDKLNNKELSAIINRLKIYLLNGTETTALPESLYNSPDKWEYALTIDMSDKWNIYYFVVSSDMVGSTGGTTGPLSN